MNIFLLRILFFLAKNYYSQKYKNISIKQENRDLFENEEKKQIIWHNNAKAVFNLQFDDFSAQIFKEKQINFLFNNFLKKHSFLKTTLFIVPNANFKNQEGIVYGWEKDENQYNLSNKEYQEGLINWLKNNDEQIEISCHGLNHFQNNIKYFLPEAEFEFQKEEQVILTIKKALSIFSKIGFEPKGFRPPAWGIGYNSDFGLIKALGNFNFSYVSLSSIFSGLNWDKKRVSNIYPQYFDNLLNMPQNISILWPLEKIKQTIDKIIDYNGLITLMGHYKKQEKYCDGLTKEKIEKIEKILNYLSEKYQNQIWYAKLNQVADFWRVHY